MTRRILNLLEFFLNIPIYVISYSSLTSTIRNDHDWVDYIDSNGNEIRHAQLNKYWDLELVNESETDIDWEQRRYELAKAYSIEFVKLQHEEGRTECGILYHNVVQWFVELADALIAELKKDKPKEE